MKGGTVPTPDLRAPGHIFDRYGRIARCAADYQIDAVLSPSGLVTGDAFKAAFDTDRAACLAMRVALDESSGKGIAIDYLPVVRLTDPTNEERRLELIAGLSGLPLGKLRDVYIAQAEERQERGGIARVISPSRHATPYYEIGA